MSSPQPWVRPTTLIEDRPQSSAVLLSPLSRAASTRNRNSIAAPCFATPPREKQPFRSSIIGFPTPPPEPLSKMAASRFPPRVGSRLHQAQYPFLHTQAGVAVDVPPSPPSKESTPISPHSQYSSLSFHSSDHSTSHGDDLRLYFSFDPHSPCYGSQEAGPIDTLEDRGRRLTLQIPSIWPVERPLAPAEPTLETKNPGFRPAAPKITTHRRQDTISLLARMQHRQQSESPAPSLGSGTSSDDGASHGSCPSTPQIGHVEAIGIEDIGIPQLNSAAQSVLARFNMDSDSSTASEARSEGSDCDSVISAGDIESFGSSSRSRESSLSDQYRSISPVPIDSQEVMEPQLVWTDPTQMIGVGDTPNTSRALTFYGLPWNSTQIMEQIVSTNEDSSSTVITPGPPTALRIPAGTMNVMGSSIVESPVRMKADNDSRRSSLEPPVQLFDRSGALMADGAHWLNVPDDFDQSSSTSQAKEQATFEDEMGLNEFYGFVPPSPLVGGQRPACLQIDTSVGTVVEYDPTYEQSLLDQGNRSIDRTNSWLVSQSAVPPIGEASPLVSLPRRESSRNPLRKMSFNIATDIFAPLEEDILDIDDDDKRDLKSGAPRLPSLNAPKVMFPTPPPSDALSPSSARAVPVLASIPETATVKFPALPEPAKTSLFYRGFKYLREASVLAEKTSASPGLPPAAPALVYGKIRDEAMRMSRTCLPTKHRDMLAGVFAIVETPSDKKRFSPIMKKDESEDEYRRRMCIAQAERERQVMEQLAPVSWVLDATKSLHGNSLLISPAKQEFQTCLARWNERSPDDSFSPISYYAETAITDPCLNENCPTVIDLGGRSTADWAWEVALEFPNARVFTITTGGLVTSTTEAVCEKEEDPDSLCSPLNHIDMKVENLWTLPFPSNSVDVISARSLYTMLKTANQSRSLATINESSSALCSASMVDEYRLTLAEIHRVLKPGGYLEFSLLDADVLGGGDRTQELSVNFCNYLKRSDYDPVPTKNFVSRLREVGFSQIQRSWMILPMCGVGCPSNGDSAEVRLSKYLKSKQEFKTAVKPIDIECDASMPTRSVVQKIRSFGKLKDHTRNSSGKWNGRTTSMGTPLTANQTAGSLWSILSNKTVPVTRSPPSARAGSVDGIRASSPTGDGENGQRRSVNASGQVGKVESSTESGMSSQSDSDVAAPTQPIPLGCGTTASASYVTGMVGAWAWEQWLLRLHKEIGMDYADDGVLLRLIAEALDEGARTGAAWRYLTGWARKDMTAG